MQKKRQWRQGLAIILSTMLIGCSIPKDIFAEDTVSNHETKVENNVKAPPVPQPKQEVIKEEDIPEPPQNEVKEEPEVGSEIIEERTEDSKTFYVGNGKYRKEIYFAPVHRKKPGKKQFENISSGVTEDVSDVESLETENTAIETKFKKKMKNGKYATYTSNGHKLTFSILKASGENKPTLDVADVIATYKKKNNKIVHKEIFPDIDLRNILFDQNIKEDIILRNKYNGYNQFTFEIETDLTANKNENGGISFVDDKNKEIFNVPAPIMTDSNINPHSGDAVSSDKVSFTLKKITKGYKLTLVADSTWLEDPARVYPVHIDPTASINITLDTYVSSATPDTNYEKNKWDEGLLEYVIRAGKYSESSGTNHAFLKHNISSIYGKNIIDATLEVFVTHAYKQNNPNGLWVKRVDGELSMNSVTWNNQPSATHITSTNVAMDNWAIFNVTSTVQDWVKGIVPNNGFRLDTGGHDEQEYWKKITSYANSSLANSIHQPRVLVTFSEPPTPAQVKNLKAEVSNNIGEPTGNINLSWDPVEWATSYRIGIFNGKNYTEIPVGNVTNYSTNGKGIWPTEAEIEAGRYQLHTDGLGENLPIDPRPVFTNGYNAGGEYGDYRKWVNHFVYVRAVNSSGVAGSGSAGVSPTIPLEKPEVIGTTGEAIDNKVGFVDLEWKEVPGAEGYKIYLFNGYDYQIIDAGDTTYWSSLAEGLYPTSDEISQGVYRFHTDGEGDDLPNRPWNLYRNGANAGGLYGNYSNFDNYWINVSAYVGGKNSGTKTGGTPVIPVGDPYDVSPIDMNLFEEELSQSIEKFFEPLPPVEAENPNYIDDQTTPISQPIGSENDGVATIRTEMAILSNNAYKNLSTNSKETFNGWDLVNKYTNKSTSFDVQLYKKSTGKKTFAYTFAFRGTQEQLDKVQDAKQVALNVGGLQAQDAEAYVKKYIKQAGSNLTQIYFTGHSLGGYLAAWIESDIVDASSFNNGKNDNVKFSNVNRTFAYTFNAPGLSLNTLPSNNKNTQKFRQKVSYKNNQDEDRRKYDGYIEAVAIFQDPVSGLPLNNLGKFKTYHPKDRDLPIQRRHDMKNFLDIKLY